MALKQQIPVQPSVLSQIEGLQALINYCQYMLYLVMLFAFLVYKFMSTLVPKGFGPAGALGWALTGIIEILKYHKEYPNEDIFLFAATAAIGFIILTGHIFEWRKEGYLLSALHHVRHFLFKVCSPAGATYFTLMWLALVLQTVDKVLWAATPLTAILAISAAIACLAIYSEYFGDKKTGYINSLFCFISRVPGTGGAVNWFLTFLVFTGVSASSLVMITLPAAAMLIAGVIWYLEHQKTDPENQNKSLETLAVIKPCLHCLHGRKKDRVQTEDIKEQREVSVKSHQGGLITCQQ